MVWSSLGTKVLTNQWQLIDIPVNGSALILTELSYEQDTVRYTRRIHLAEYFYDGFYRFLKSIPVVKEKFMMELVLSDMLQQAGYVTRYLAVKHDLFGFTEGDITIDIRQWFPGS